VPNGERNQLEDLDVNGGILKLIFKEQGKGLGLD
jgi:hypothetical protein